MNKNQVLRIISRTSYLVGSFVMGWVFIGSGLEAYADPATLGKTASEVVSTDPSANSEHYSERARQLYLEAREQYIANDYYAALSSYRKSLYLYNLTGDLSDTPYILHGIGAVYQQLGDLDRAVGYYNDALKSYRIMGDRKTEANLLVTLASAYRSLGQYADAVLLLESVLPSFDNQELISDRAFLLNNLGITYRFLGNYSEAETAYQESLRIYQQLGDQQEQATVLSSLGYLFQFIGNPEEQLFYYQQALELAREVNDPVNIGYALNNSADVLSELGRYSEALEHLAEAQLIFESINDTKGLSWTLDTLGNTYLGLGDIEQARITYQQALSISQDSGDRATSAEILQHLGELYVQQQQPELAIVFYKQAVNELESIRTELRSLDLEQQQSYTETVAATYRTLIDLLLSQGRILEAQQVLDLLKLEELREFTRTRSGLESDVGIFLNAIEAAILDEFNTLTAFGQQLSDCEQTRCAQLNDYRQLRQLQFTRFDDQVTAFVATIRDNRASDDFFYDPRYLNETARDIVAQPGTLLIYPFVTDDQLWLLYSADGDVAGAVPIEVSQLELGNAVVEFRRLLESPFSDLDDLHITAQQLYDWLIAPLEPEITANDITTLVFSQDRITRYIPMAALWDNGEYLAERYTLSTILSAELTDTEDRLSLTAAENPVTAFGLSAQVRNFNALPNVESELDAVVRETDTDELGIFPGRQFLNDDFNRSNLTTNIFGSRILHIATHGEFVSGLPEESYLLFGDGQPFSIPDINSLGSDLRDVHLVVLSACETAVGGPTADGIEVAGISSYFLAANRASAVLASLWQVNDASTSLLMQAFYTNLANGMTKGDALRQAQLTLLNGEFDETQIDNLRRTALIFEPADNHSTEEDTVPSLAHPYYWAPFILIGNGL